MSEPDKDELVGEVVQLHPTVHRHCPPRAGKRRPVIPLHMHRENLRGVPPAGTFANWHCARYYGLRLRLHLVA